MTESQASSAKPTAEELAKLQEEIAALKAENEELKSEVAAQPEVAASAHPGRGRTALAIVGIIIASLLIGLAVPAVWMNRMATDTEWYVRTVTPLAQDPAIQNAVATSASNAIIQKLDSQTRLEALLPQNLQILAAPVGSAIDDFVRKKSQELVQSDQFEQIWITVNRTGHKALVAAVTGETNGVVGVQAGTITLDVSALADAVKAKLVDAGLGIVANIPTSGLNSQLVIYQSPALAQATVAVGAISKAAIWIPLLGLILAGSAIAVATDRRRAMVWLGAGVTIAGLLPLNLIYFGQFYATQQIVASAGIPSAAAQNAFQIIFRDLVTADQSMTFLGIVIWIGAVLVGPAGWAVSMRKGMSGGLAGVASHLELGRFGDWVAARRRGLRFAGIPIAIVFLMAMPAPRTISQVAWMVVLLLVWIFLVELVGAAGSVDDAVVADDEPAADADDGTPATT